MKNIKFELDKREKVENPPDPPAFPIVYENGTFESGMTLLDYFIAHAPSTPQWDFDIPMETERQYPKDEKNLADPLWNEMRKWDELYAKRKIKMWAAEWARVQLIERLK